MASMVVSSGQSDLSSGYFLLNKLKFTGQRGFLNGQEYVLIKAKYNGTDSTYLKWATQNLAVTDSGRANWRSTDFVIGDYFQWAAYEGYVTGTKSENLVIYTSFTSDGNSPSFSGWKDSKQFNKASAPYGGGSYNKYTSGSITLGPDDDVANIVLGGTWRMPTGGNDGEFQAMREATYWVFEDNDNGYYVFNPGVGTLGAAGGKGTGKHLAETDDKSKALLFFPSAGFGRNTGGDGCGLYWTSTLYSSDNEKAYNVYLHPDFLEANTKNFRSDGNSVRPVSD